MLKEGVLFIIVVTSTPSSRPAPNLEPRPRFVEVVCCKIEAWIQASTGFNPMIFDTGAVLYLLRYEATSWEQVNFCGSINAT